MMGRGFILFGLLLGILHVEGVSIDACESLEESSNSITKFLKKDRDYLLEPKIDPLCESYFGIFKYPKDCHKYVVCVDGRAIIEACPEGQVFDEITGCNEGKCASQELQSQKISADPLCEDDVGIFTYPKDHHKYVVCINDHAKIEVCPEGEVFDEHFGCKEEHLCEEDLGIFKYPKDCHKYVVCINGRSIIQDCPKGQVFDSLIGCKEGKCQDNSTDPLCEEDLGIFVYRKDCHKYVVCINGRAVIQDCPKGQVFEEFNGCEEGKCASQELQSQENSADPVCEGNLGIFLYPRDCHKYVECINGRAIIHVCPEGQVFNVLTGCKEGKCSSQELQSQENSDSLCEEDLGIFGYPKDCHKYVVCINGRAIIQFCPEGQVFNVVTGCKEGKCLSQEVQSQENSEGIIVGQLRPDICFLPLDKGLCKKEIKRFYFNKSTKRCDEFIYHGCDGNQNNFESFHDCWVACYPKPELEDENRTKKETSVCDLPPETGPCRANIKMYYYDQASKTCKTFVYGGCDGNENKFFDKDTCQRSCLFQLKTTAKETPETTTTHGELTCSGNGLYPHPSDCNKFIECRDNVADEMRCPSGLHFSRTDERCVYPCDAKCDSDIHCELDGKYCKPATCFECPQKVGRYADAYDCSIYMECTNRIPRLKKCKLGKYFDYRSRSCVPESKVKCKYECRKPDALYVYPHDCERFVECKNSISTVKKCPSGQAFHPEKLQCVDLNESKVNFSENDIMGIIYQNDDVWE